MFIDEFFEKDFYQKLGLNYASTFNFGQFFLTHAYYPHENLELWRPIPDASEPTKTIATKFHIVSSAPDKFKKSLPLGAPPLETNEEFLVIRAKIRPVVLIRPEIPLPPEINKGFRGKLARKRCLIAQVYSLKDTKTGVAKFSPDFVARMRKLEFPQFLFFPQKAGILEVDSFLRLDECQSVFTKHLDPLQFALSDDLRSLLRWQLQALFVDSISKDYAELREMMLDS
ncbi:MAG: hypothetical protein ACREEM_20155 [Blastocatellia bacterium]